MIKKFAYTIFTVTLAAGIGFSQDAAKMETKTPAKKAASAKGGMLQPQMEPTGGWTAQGEMGQKTDAPWSNTSVAASVDGKPVAGKTATVTGEIVDLSCYLQLGKHGDKHASCGKKCIANGQPVGLLTKAGQVYLLVDEEHDPRRDGQTTFRKSAGENFAKVMTVTGTETTVNGVKALYVQGYLNK